MRAHRTQVMEALSEWWRKMNGPGRDSAEIAARLSGHLEVLEKYEATMDEVTSVLDILLSRWDKLTMPRPANFVSTLAGMRIKRGETLNRMRDHEEDRRLQAMEEQAFRDAPTLKLIVARQKEVMEELPKDWAWLRRWSFAGKIAYDEIRPGFEWSKEFVEKHNCDDDILRGEAEDVDKGGNI